MFCAQKESMNNNNSQKIPLSKLTPANDDPGIAPSGMGAPPVSVGYKIEPLLPDDDLDVEKMAEESSEAAEEDLMREARKAEKRNNH